MRGSGLQGERKDAHERDEMLLTGCVWKEDLSDGCQIPPPSSIEFTLFGYMLIHALSIERRGQGVLEGAPPTSWWVFSEADALWVSISYCLPEALRISAVCICGSCSNWSHLELSISVLKL